MYANNPRRRTVSPFCRITGKSHSMDEHHYMPCSDDYPRLEMSPCCRITEKNSPFRDYHFVYPVLDIDGVTRLVTEHDFHCRITAKYRVMAGQKYVYPLLGSSNNKTVNDMTSVVDDECYAEVLIPSEVEQIVRGGIKDVMKLNDSEYLFIYSKEGSLFPSALKEIPPKRIKAFGKYSRRHTVPVTLEAQMALTLGGEDLPKVKKIKELKMPPPPPPSEELPMMADHIEVLKDVRKSRPRKPRKTRNRGQHINDDKETNNIVNDNSAKRPKLENNVDLKNEIIEECEIEEPPKPLSSRLEKFKLQFQNYEVKDTKTSENILVMIGAFDPNDVVELDFGDSSMETNDQTLNVNGDASVNGRFTETGEQTDYSTETRGQNGIITESSVSDIVNGDENLSSVPSVSVTLEENNRTSELLQIVELPDQQMVNKNGTGPDVNGKFSSVSFSDTISDLSSISDGRTSSMSLKSDSSSGRGTVANDLNNNLSDKIVLSDNNSMMNNKKLGSSMSKVPDFINEATGTNCIPIAEQVSANLSEISEIPPDFSNINITERKIMVLNEKSLSVKIADLSDDSSRQSESKTNLTSDLINDEVNASLSQNSMSKEFMPLKIEQISLSNDLNHLMNREKLSENKDQHIKKCSPGFQNDTNSHSLELKQSCLEQICQGSNQKREVLNSFHNNEEHDGHYDLKYLQNDQEDAFIENSVFKKQKIENIDMKLDEQLEIFQLSASNEKCINNSKEYHVKGNLSITSVSSLDGNEITQGQERDIVNNVEQTPAFNDIQMEIDHKEHVQKCQDEICSEKRSNRTKLKKWQSIEFKSELFFNDTESMDSNQTSKDIDIKSNYPKSHEDISPSNNHNLRYDMMEVTERKESHIYDNYNIPDNAEQLPNIPERKREKESLENDQAAFLKATHIEDSSKGFQTELVPSQNQDIVVKNFDNRKGSDEEQLKGTYSLSQLNEKTRRDNQETISLMQNSQNSDEMSRIFESKIMNQKESIPDMEERENMLHNVNSRLPVTCSLMLKGSSLPVKVSTDNRCQGLVDDSSGHNTTIRNCVDSTDKGAKWNGVLQAVDVYMAIMDFQPMESDEESVPMKEGQEVEVIDATKPRRWLVRTRPLDPNERPQEGWVPACYLEKSTAEETISDFAAAETARDAKEAEAIENREAVVRELVETEEDFAKDMQFVVDNYYKRLDDPQVPKELRDRKGSIFGNFKDICDFHNNVLMKGVNYHAKEPTKLGKTFLRLERDFDMHANYCWNEARAQRILKDDQLKNVFENFSQTIGDDKIITDHLKLPIQRLNDYQLLLKELIKYSVRLNEETSDLQKALDFIHGINKRTNDLQYILSIQGCQGDLLKLGRIIRHDVFDVSEDTAATSAERHVFLFKGRIIIAEKKTGETGEEIFQATNAFKLPDVEITENVESDSLKILFRHSKKCRLGFPFYLRARSMEQKETLIKEMNANSQITEDLGEDEPVVIQDVLAVNQKDEAKEEALASPGSKHKVSESIEPEQKKPKILDQEQKPVIDKTEEESKVSESKPPVKRQSSLKSEEPDTAAADSKDAKPLQRRQSIKRQDSQSKKKKSISEKESGVVDTSADLPPKPEDKLVKRQDSLDKTKKELKDRPESLKRQKSSDTEPIQNADTQPEVDSKKKTSLKRQESSEKSKARQASGEKKKKDSVHEKVESKVKEPIMAEKPAFVKPLRGVTCGLGETATLECETSGNPVPSVTWLKDNQRLAKGKKIQTSSKGQKHSLTIKETSAEDGGLYTVVANNAQGSASCSALLNLKLSLLGLPKEDSRPSTPGGTILPHAPVFKVKLNKETQLLEGTCVRFELVVRGNPEPTVKFFKDGKELKLDDRVRVAYENKEIFELILDHVSAKDAGTYSCEATNNLGSDTTTGNLCVVKNKDVFRGLEECLVEEERTPTPRPRTPRFKWFKDGQDFEASERFQVIFNEEEDSLALMFQHVTPDDAGLYTCVASTSTGSKIACSAELTVQGVVREVEAPAIKAELADVEATEGGSAMLELKITGYPKPKVTWFHKKKEVATGGRYRFLFADEESFTLVIKNIKKDDSGQYSVKAVNEIGEAESSCQLTVKSAPSFCKGLKDMSVMAEEVLAFEVEIDGNPAPDVKWYKDGQQLNPSDRIAITTVGDKKCCLKISKAKLSDCGSYSCVLTNALGSQAEFSNVVVKASPTFVKGMENVVGLEGDSLHFSVEVSGNPKPTLKWSKDGKELKPDGKHVKVIEEGINAYTLAIDSVTPADVGVYTCELRNEHGIKASSGNLTIKTKPEFVKKLTDNEVNEGDTTLSLTVTIKGYPPASVKWLLEEENLADNKNCAISSDLESLGNNIGSYTLKLKKATRQMAGKYSCVASNEMGSATSVGTLKVNVVNKKPEFDQSLKPTQLVEGKPGKLVAKVSGEPRPNIQWLKDGKPITLGGRFRIQEEPDGTVTLLIDDVTSSDAGLYSIIATSPEGEAKCDAAVTTIPPGRKPEFVKELEEANIMECKPLTLVAKITGKPTSVKWQKDGKDITPSEKVVLTEEDDGTVSLKINRASVDDAGKYAVVASNAEGKARSVALVQVKACSKPSIDSALTPLTLVDGETGQLKLKVSGEPKPTLEWLKDGKPLKTSNRVALSEEPDGTVVLTINNARPEDAGKYTVIASNDMGEVESAAPVVVNQAPTFQKQLEPVEVVEGFPAKLEAKLSGSPPPEIKWLKDGKEVIPDGEHIKEVRSPDGTIALLIENCKPEDAAKYSLIAKNSLGEKESNGSLGVTSKKTEGEPESIPSFLGPLNNVSVKEGESIHFEALISGNPLPDISWTVNGETVKPSEGKLITFDGKRAILDLKNCSPEDAGTYQCILSNPLGKASSEGTAAVQSKTAPRFVQQLTDYTGIMGNPLILSCRVKGYPEPEVDWYFNGNRITPSAKYSISKAGDLLSLSINSCQPEDSGIFECRAENSMGEDRTRSAVNISDKVEKGEPPAFLKKIGDCEVMEGMTAKFTACVSGIPTPDVKWSKDGQPLELSSRHKSELESTGILRMIIRDVDPSDYGEYSVAISNPHGSATSSAHIRPDSLDQKYISPMGDQFVGFDKFKKTGAPVPLPDKPRIIRMSDDALTLGWKPSVPTAARVPVTYQIEMSKHPGGEYEPYRSGLKDTLCDVRGLAPGQDYKFRIRVENQFGVSEPSPYTTAHRSKIRETIVPAEFVPKDFEIEHEPLEKYAAPPRFVRKEEDSMYGIRGNPVTIEFWLYGHPEPEVTWYKDDAKISRDKYAFLQDRNGKLSVFIDKMTDDYVGTYFCRAKNSEGETQTKIKLLIAEHPVFTQKLDETSAMVRRSARMQCKVSGVPYPKIKWYRDWHPLYESERVKILWEEPDVCTLFLTNLITRDGGLMSCSAANVAGTATSSATLNVEDSEDVFDKNTYSYPIMVKPRSKKFEDFYDMGDELGRGTQSVVYHAVKRDTGDSFAAKMMNGKGKFKDFMRAEMDIMTQMGHPKLVRLYDAYETPTSLNLITDICGGGELLDNILKRGTVTEREIAYYIKQLLEGLEHMHGRYIGHLGLTVGDLLVARVNSYDIRVGDFGLSAHLIPGKDYFLEYGHPEFVAPEIANKQPASLLSDMWSVGVITYLLLSGLSPFLGPHDRETLTRVKQGKINFSETAFTGVTDDAKDFMSKLLIFEPSGRMNVKTALQHKWIKYYADIPSSADKPLDNIDRLRDYYKKWKDWYANASCRKTYRRRTLESCFHDPSKMIYPPGECFTPEASPDRELKRPPVKPSQFDDITYRQKINREDIDFRSESHYQNGPDTYLLQLRDNDFPLRLRQYLRVGARTSPSLAANLRDTHWGDSTLVIRERRKFVDIMDEEIDDEKKGLTTLTTPRRLHHEVGSLGYAHEQMELLKKEVWKEKSREIEIGMAPFFREKLRDVVMKEDDEVVFRCFAVGDPKPHYTWFRNDGVLLESSRIVVTQLKDGRLELRIKPSRAYDVGVYKCVARNDHGVSVCRARLKLGGKPGRPDAPIIKDISDTEVYLTWAEPKDDGKSPTLCYALEYKQSVVSNWTVVASNIGHEYFVVRNLLPSIDYQFRVKALNKFGWGEPGFPTTSIITKTEGAEKVKVSTRRKFQQELTEQSSEYEIEEIELPDYDYSREKNPIPIVEGEISDLYRIVSEMDRGRFSVVLNVWVKETGETSVAKVIQSKPGAQSDGRQEYEIIKSLCHERIVPLLSASFKGDKTVLVMEKLSGVDVLTYLSSKQDYNEEMVAYIIRQVLDALEYLHYRGICYIELQPDNVVMINQRRPDIQLVDFGSARFVPKPGGKVLVEGTLEYLAPEVIKNELVTTGTDVWCVGVLTYILLSGISPFRGANDQETTDNVLFVRYQFDKLHKDVTMELTKFLIQIFKACPIKRPTVSECLENKWLLPSEYMIMKRESARFLPDKLSAFSKQFHSAKSEAMDPEMLTSLGLSSSKINVKDEDF